MKYGMFINLVKGLMHGDNVVPNDSDIQIALLSYAYDKVANESDALKLFSFSENNRILRDGPGNTFIRKPILPVTDTNGKIDIEYMLDIDDELCYPLARYFASFISKDKMKYHSDEASLLIRAYNSKVESHFNKLRQERLYDSK